MLNPIFRTNVSLLMGLHQTGNPYSAVQHPGLIFNQMTSFFSTAGYSTIR
ncbi:hypothetical protein ADIS_1655 [Lunatimonas lonarensis]|uniref:Uncharacterized protein n=1 Tax=Lunatimonas lonarensis TaxID=1232681 RepID=R7ZU96_9BACT|nr:hypothetical protein ADIS_1655 [Lunatimonas lonarensis]